MISLGKKLSRFDGRNPGKFNFENWVFYRKDGKKGIFLFFLGNFFHKRHVPNKVTLLHEQLRNNFKVELRWLPLTESTQIFFVTPCVSSTWVTTCHVPHVHVGTCTCRFMKARARKKVKKPNFLNFCCRKKLNSKIWGRRKF